MGGKRTQLPPDEDIYKKLEDQALRFFLSFES
jgi:hypothetical protein